MQPEVELFFCDLCNSSVPEADLAQGRARRAGERLVGACCLTQLAPPAVLAPADPGGAQPASGARAGSGALVGAGLALLAAIAAGTMFLDWRMTEERGWFEDRLHSVETVAGTQAERLAAIELAVGGLATQTDLRKLESQQGAVTERIAGIADGLSSSGSALDQRTTQIGERIERLLATAQEQALRLGTIEGELARLAGEVAAVKALPRAAPSGFEGDAEPAPMQPTAPEAAPAAAPAAPAIPPALAHEISRLSDTDPGVRFDAVDKLLQSKDLNVLPALVGALRDPDLFVRRYVADGLAAFRHVDAVDALIEALADPESIVRDTAYSSLKTLTGQKIPFESDGTKAQLAAAQRRWQDWWKGARATF